MADPTGFLTTQRQTAARRPVDVRITDWREVYAAMRHHDTQRQAGRCMDCGGPFCHDGCPLGNVIPEFKMEKWRLDRRLDQMRGEGTAFECGVEAGVDVSAADLRRDYRAVVLAGGARVPRALPVPSAGLAGIHQAMEYLSLSNRAVADLAGEPAVSARGRHVVIIGGGDTGADCLGTALRQGAASVNQLETMPRPPDQRPAGHPWPTHPTIFRGF